MRCAEISEARRLANKIGAKKLLILAIDDNQNFSFTTFGQTKAQCLKMARWADERAPYIAKEMDEQ